ARSQPRLHEARGRGGASPRRNALRALAPARDHRRAHDRRLATEMGADVRRPTESRGTRRADRLHARPPPSGRAGPRLAENRLGDRPLWELHGPGSSREGLRDLHLTAALRRLLLRPSKPDLGPVGVLLVWRLSDAGPRDA